MLKFCCHIGCSILDLTTKKLSKFQPTMEVNGDKEREMEVIPTQNDKDSELACDPGQTADGSGISVPLLHEVRRKG